MYEELLSPLRKLRKQGIHVNINVLGWFFFVNTNLLASKLCEFRQRQRTTVQLNIQAYCTEANAVFFM